MADNLTINAAAPLPDFEKRKTWETTTPGDATTTTAPGDTTSTDTTQDTAARAAGVAAEDAATQGEISAEERQRGANAAKADVGLQNAQDAADLAGHQSADQDFALRSSADDIAKAKAHTQAEQARLDKMESPSLYGNTDTHGKVMRGLSLALGGIGDAIQKAAMVRIGKAPPTIDTVQDIIDGELNRQREQIGMLKDNVVRARTGEQDATAARQQMLADIDLRGASMYKRAEAVASARLAAQGKTQADIDSDKNIAALRAKQAEHLEAHVAPLLDKVTKKIEAPTVSTKVEGPTRKSGGDTVERAPTKATGASPTGATAEQSAALARYVDAHPNASQGELVTYAAKSLGIPDAQGEVTRVAGTNSLPEKEGERQTTDFEGKPVLANGGKGAVGAVADQVTSTKRYVKALDDLIDSVGEGGVGKAIKSKIPGTELHSKIDEVVALGAPAMGFTLSDSRKKMDDAIAGAGGVGVLSGSTVDNLKRLRAQAIEYGQGQVSARTTPVRAPPEASTSARAPKSSDTSVSKVPAPDQTAAKAWLVSPEAKADPAKRKRVYDKLKSMGVTF